MRQAETGAATAAEKLAGGIFIQISNWGNLIEGVFLISNEKTCGAFLFLEKYIRICSPERKSACAWCQEREVLGKYQRRQQEELRLL